MLQHHSFVQLFSTYADLTGETATSHLGHRPYRMSASFAWNYLHQSEFLSSRRARARRSRYLLRAQLVVPSSKSISLRSCAGSNRGRVVVAPGCFRYGGWDVGYLRPGQRGLAHGLRAGASDERGRGNEAMHAALRGIGTELAGARRETEPHRRPLADGVHRQLRHACFSRQQSAARLWRAVGAAAKWDFNPATDIARDYQGLWRWTGNKPGLRDDVARYFIERSEDGPLLLGETPLV